ncbi:MAG: hypothetical protein R6U96_16120 [Promethearchaeia archaeon]
MDVIVIDNDWDDRIIEIAQKFNKYVKKHSMRMISFYLDKAFDIMADDTNENQYDAANFLKRVRNLNPNLISTYMSALIDTKTEKEMLSKEEYLVPDYSKYPVSGSLQENIGNSMNLTEISSSENDPEENDSSELENANSANLSEDNVVLRSSEDVPSKKREQDHEKKSEEALQKDGESEQSSASEASSQTTKTQQEPESNMLNWRMEKLIRFRIIKNLEKVTYAHIESPIKKCALGDGIFEKEDDLIWQCKKCKTAYHENCAKITAIFDGKCKICDAPFK